VGPSLITLKIVIFAPLLHKVYLPANPPTPLLGSLSASTLTDSNAYEPHVNLYTNVNTVAQTTLGGYAHHQDGACPLSKPLPWTPIRPLILEWELSQHPNKALVEQLVHDLLHGCSIGYSGPLFAHSANNLVSAFQKPDVIDASLQREYEAGRILGPFPSPPYLTFALPVWGLSPNTMVGGGLYITFCTSPPQY